MQIGEQVLNILLTQLLTVSGHFIASETNDVADAVIIGRQAAERQIFVFENPLEPWAFLATSGIRFVTAIAFRIVNLPSRRLLWVEPKFGIGLAALDIARPKGKEHD